MENQTENKGVYFTSLKLQNVRCFGEEAVLDLSDGKGGWARWNVILGDNGTGKTTLLQAAAECQLIGFASANKNEGKTWLSKHFVTKGLSFATISDDSTATIQAALIEYPELREAETEYLSNAFFGGVSSLGIHERDFSAEFHFILGYGATRFMNFGSLSESQSEISETLFDDDARLINAEEWLLSANYNASIDSGLKQRFIQRRNLIKSILTDILPGVTDIAFPPPTKENDKPRVEFKTEFGWVTIRQLSLGYKTMVAWMVDVAARMFERYPDSENPLAEPVVILVDEIDLHLHPQWQRKIFDYLTEKFPKAQFIVTAHSPLVVQSAPKDANIILLKKETDEAGNSYVKIDNDVESVRNWRLDQILTSDLFGLESARNPDVEKDLEERKTLLQKQHLSDSEKARLEDLNRASDKLPTAEDPLDREAMDVIRQAAEAIKKKRDAV